MCELTEQADARWARFLEEYDEKHDRPLLYIAGPMASEGNPYTNIKDAIDAAGFARMAGWAVIIPHLDCLVSMVNGVGDAEYYLINDFNMLDRCDAVLLLPTKMPRYPDGSMCGAEKEIDFAEKRGIPVYTLETLPSAYQFDQQREENA